jgi:hypothetical protein
VSGAPRGGLLADQALKFWHADDERSSLFVGDKEKSFIEFATSR